MKHIKTLRIDIDKKNFEVIPSVQYDTNTRFLHIYLLNNSIAFDITNCSVKISGTKPDGTNIFNNCNIINAKEGFVEAELTEQMNAVAGKIKCELKIYNGNGVLTTKQFNIEVTESITSKEIVSTNEFKALTDAINSVQNIDNRFAAVGEQFNTIENSKADKSTTNNIQTQVNNLVLQAGNPESSSAEIVQARGKYNVLNDRLDASDKAKVGFNKMKKPLRTLLRNNVFTVNFQDLKVYVNNSHNFIVDADDYVQFNTSQLADIDIPKEAIDPIVYKQYTFWYDITNGTLKFTPSRECSEDYSIVFGHFYQGKPYLNNEGNGIQVIDKNGNTVLTSFYDVDKKFKDYKYACIYNGSMNIDTTNHKVVFNNTTLIFTAGQFFANLGFTSKEVSWGDFNNTNDAIWIWFDSKNTDIVITNNPQNQIPTDYFLICIYYSNNIYNCICRNKIYVNGKRLEPDYLSSAPELKTTKLSNPLRTFVNADTLQVNFQDLKVYVKRSDSFYVTEYGYVDCRKSDGSQLDDIVIPSEALTEYTLYMLWFDHATHTLNFTRADSVPSNGINFGLFYRGKPYLANEGNGIQVIDKNGKTVITRLTDIVNKGMSHVTFYNNADSGINTMAIDYDTTNYTITATSLGSRWFMFEHSSITTKTDKTFVLEITSESLTYCYKLFVNMNDGTPLIKKHTDILTDDEIKNYAYVCMFDNTCLHAPTFNPACILIDGKIPKTRNALVSQNNTGSYNWNNNRFVLPSDLYLVKNIPYSISATDFNMEQLKDNDDCLFEITLPTKVVQFEQTADILIPYSYEQPFKTRISGKYKTSNSILTQDINLHVADPVKVIKKDITVLCIGDSITNSNYPKHLKWQLSQMGINATMIGTVNNSHESYGYGISQYLTTEKGEGRGGWRLTDFCCNTPLIGGGYYTNSYFPMMNPDTGKFDFSYYMQNQGFSNVDFVVINLGTNDISGYHYAGSELTNSAYGTIRRVDLDTEYLNSESEFYLGTLYKTLIDSIHAYDSNIKIAINPPMGAGDSNFIVNAMKWAEICQYELKNITNVYNLSSYASQAQLSASNIESSRNDMVQVNSKNNTYKFSYVPSDVHYNGMGQLIHTLYPASWIVNMCL